MAASVGWGTRFKALAIFVGLVGLLALGTTLLVLVAFGMGALLSFFVPLSAFEASLLSMLGMLGLLAAGWRLIEHIAHVGPPVEWHQEAEDVAEEASVDSDSVIDHEVIEAVVDTVARNARCPCGSRRKFKNCCARKAVVGTRS